MISPGLYQYFRQERVIFGHELASAVPAELARHAARRVFIVATRSLSRKTDVVERLCALVGPRLAGKFDEVEPHVPREVAVTAAYAAREAGADLIISIGGGSAVDTGKMVQICLAENIRHPRELDRLRVRTDDAGATVVPFISPPPLRQICIPTTLSGGEFSHTAGSTDHERNIKDIYIQDDLAAPAVILDPAITVHTPEWVWLASGMRAVDHAVGSLCSRNPNPFTDATTAIGLDMLNRSLRAVRQHPDDLQIRLESQIGVWLSSTGMMRMQYGASHGLSWHLSAVADVAHGHCSCVLLPSVLRYNQPVTSERQCRIAEILGAPEKSAADAVLDLIKALDMPWRMRDVGVKVEHLDKIATDAMQNLLVRNNVRAIDRVEQVREVLDMAW